MDIFRFINSKDIRNYNRELGTDFSLPVSAYLIWQCVDATWQEKVNAWNELIKTTNDCSMQERMHIPTVASFHSALENYIRLIDAQISEFQRTWDDWIFTYSVRYGTDDAWCNSNRFCHGYKNCLSHLTDTITASRIDGASIDGIQLRKIPLYDYNDSLTDEEEILYMNENMEIMGIDAPYGDYFEALYLFEAMWVDIPTPFRRGDILVSTSECRREPFVLHSICNWNTHLMIENGFPAADAETLKRDRLTDRFARLGDSSDMSYTAYFSDIGNLYRDHGHEYLSLERYRGVLKEENKILKPLSELIQNRLDITDFLVAFQKHQISHLPEEPIW